MPTWPADAACRGQPVDWWYPPPGDHGGLAQAICSGCCVRVECLAAAIVEEVGTNARRYGVRGGLTARQRVGMRPARVNAVVVPVETGVSTPTEAPPRVVHIRHRYVVAL